MIKDFSDIHICKQDSEEFAATVRKILDLAIPYAEIEIADTEDKKAEHWEICKDLATKPRILDTFASVAAISGVAGEVLLIKLLFLAVVSRFLSRIVSIVLKGPSSAGKSYLVRSVLRFFPSESYYLLTAMSERALIYSEEPYKHRFLVLCEAESLKEKFIRYIVRSLLSEGFIRYTTVEKTDFGLRPREIYKEGPTGLLSTTTDVILHGETETRILSVSVSDDPEQTKRIFNSIADRYVAQQYSHEQVDLSPWHSLQCWLALGELRVVIPYAHFLVNLIPPVAVRLRRDIDALLSLISTHALLHRASRTKDPQGCIVASIDDYVIVRELLCDLMSASVEVSVPKTIRETVRAVEKLGGGTSSIITVTIKMVADDLKLDKSSVTRRIHAAIQNGFLINESEKGRPARLKLGDLMPNDTPILPLPETVEKLMVSSGGGSKKEVSDEKE